jgi:hypothetical protein
MELEHRRHSHEFRVGHGIARLLRHHPGFQSQTKAT